MAVHGYPEALDRALTHSHDGIIQRILAIRNGGGVCYNVHNLAGVMNAIKNLGDSWRNDHSIYLIAEKAFWGESGLKTEWFTVWTAQVREAIKQREERYLRDGKYDELLSLLFSELRPGLSHGFGRRLVQKRHSNGRTPNMQGNVTEWGSSDNDDGWLKGWALKEWLRKHPGWPRQEG